jgi:hypothetical protein
VIALLVILSGVGALFIVFRKAGSTERSSERRS